MEEWKSARTGEGDLPELEEVLYVGTVGGLEAEIVPKAGLSLRTVSAGALRGLSPWRMLLNGVALLRGTFQSWCIVRSFRPDVLLATGGYASVPVAVAAWLARCSVLIYLPDIEPGLAVRLLSRLASKVAVSFDAALGYFPPGKAVVTGYPVRPGLYGGDKEAARARLGLAPGSKTLLILGGSRGAHSINVAVSDSLPALLQMAQVIHVAGDQDAPWLQERRAELPAALQERYRVYAYLHDEMIAALQAADVAVARAGAATMGEFAAVGLPAILVPYPHSGRHQEANAEWMASRGAALQVSDSALAEGALLRTLKTLLSDDQARLAMAENARKLARPDAARAIARQLASLAGGN